MLFEGSLSKWTNVIQGWQYRFFVLDPTQGMLIYYTVGSMGKGVEHDDCHRSIFSPRTIWSKVNGEVSFYFE